ncbi:MAG: PD40 domain-containing protein [Planctomycetes bacterium]|nr:PD40 domain-containing protein [Planctomycetota bacterium]
MNPANQGGDGASTTCSISADGRFICFRSYAADLVPNDLNERADIFVHDQLYGTTERVSVDNFGVEGDASSYESCLSADGRYVAFRSFASNLVPNDTNIAYDIFVHDRLTQTMERVSVRANGVEGNLGSSFPCISADGRFVAFHSVANNLVTDDSNNQVDIFLHDRNLGITGRVSVTSAGGQANNRSQEPSMSANGRWIAFQSMATNLTSSDSNGVSDIFVRDNLTMTTEMISVSSTGLQANADCLDAVISADGRFVSFYSEASNLVTGDSNGVADVFVHDRQTGMTERVSVDSNNQQANAQSSAAQMSADGRFIVFQSLANNLIPADTNPSEDIFLRDRLTGQTERLNLTELNQESDGYAYAPAISADARRIIFWSSANNYTANDLHGEDDVFLRDRGAGSTQNSVLLTGPLRRSAQQTINLSWYGAPHNSPYALVASLNTDGYTFAGHRYDVGAPFQMVASGTHQLPGTGSYTSAPLPANLSGTILYFELAVLDAGGIFTDSIVHAVQVD